MTSLDLNIGDLHQHDADDNFTRRALTREKTERRLGLMLLAIIGVLTVAALTAGTSLTNERSSPSIESKTMSQVFDVSKGVRRL